MIEEYLNLSFSDAKPEVRQMARICFLKYKEIFPNRGKHMFAFLDLSVQKAIYDEDECKFMMVLTIIAFNMESMSRGSLQTSSRKSESAPAKT